MEPRRDNDTEIQPSGGDQMKVGDLVKQVSWDGVGIVVERQGQNFLGVYWRVLFGNELIYVREADMEVINESR